MYGAQACMESGSAFTIEFTQEFGNLPTIVPDATNLFYAGAVRPKKLLVVTQQQGTKESAYCSNRGLCDQGTSSALTQY